MGSTEYEYAGSADGPRAAWAAMIAAFPVPLYGLVPQPALVNDAFGSGSSGGGEREVTLAYRILRNPGDLNDPRNQADPAMLASPDEPPVIDDLPAWHLELDAEMRWARLQDAVRTTWRESGEYDAEHELRRHLSQVLITRYRDELGFGAVPHGWPEVSASAVNRRVTAEVDGERVPAVEIDTDPFVYGVGVVLPTGGVLSAVVPRDDLPLLRIAFARR